MKNRRDFLVGVATGVVVLGAHAKDGLAGIINNPLAEASKPKVIVAHDPQLRGSNGRPNDNRVLALLDRSIAASTGLHPSVEAWKHILGPAKRIGIKVNLLGGKGLCTHVSLVLAVCERLHQAGILESNIIVWDRLTREFETCGYTVSTDPNHLRCFGTDMAGYGYEEQPVSFGRASVKLSRILTRHCDMVINLPILKDHSGAGITFSMKNMYGVVERPMDLHGGGCNPYVADLNRIPAIHEKVRFTIGDAFTACYQGGPGFQPENTWQPDSLLVGVDRVAIDHTALQIIEHKRMEMKLPTLEAAGRPARYIATAADADHQLGFDDPTRFSLVEI